MGSNCPDVSGELVHHGARTAENQDSVEQELGPPHSERVERRLEVIDGNGRAGVYGLTLSWVQDGPEPFAAR